MATFTEEIDRVYVPKKKKSAPYLHQYKPPGFEDDPTAPYLGPGGDPGPPPAEPPPLKPAVFVPQKPPGYEDDPTAPYLDQYGDPGPGPVTQQPPAAAPAPAASPPAVPGGGGGGTAALVDALVEEPPAPVAPPAPEYAPAPEWTPYEEKPFEYDESQLNQAQQWVSSAKAAFDNSIAEFSRATQREYRVRWMTAEDGFEYPIIEYQDVGGTWQVDGSQNFRAAYEALDQAYDALRESPKTFQEWLNGNPNYGSFRDLNPLIEQAEELQRQWEGQTLDEAGFERAALSLGFGSARELQDWLRQARQDVPDNVSAAEGLSGEDRAVMDRQHRAATAEMYDQMERDIDAISGETGSTMRAFQAADGYRRQISNANLRYVVSVAQEDWVRKQTNFEARRSRYERMVEQGLMAQSQAATSIAEDRAIQMQALAIQIATAQAQNAQLMALSQHDQMMLNNYVGQLLNVANMDMGMGVAVREEMDKAFERHVRPYALRMESYLQGLVQSLEIYEVETHRQLEEKRMHHAQQQHREQLHFEKYRLDLAQTNVENQRLFQGYQNQLDRDHETRLTQMRIDAEREAREAESGNWLGKLIGTFFGIGVGIVVGTLTANPIAGVAAGSVVAGAFNE